MTNAMAPGIPLAIAVFVALAAAALRAAARRPGPQGVPGTELAPVPTTADQSQPRPTVTTGTHDRAVRQMAVPLRPPRRPARAVEQAQHIFHELHADGRNVLCVVCDDQYRSALLQVSVAPAG
jgi:hypothetical protein